MKKATEKEIENLILEWLNLQPGCYAFKQDIRGLWDPTRKTFRKPGKHVPIGGADILGVRYGKFFAFEVKTPEAHKKFMKSTGAHEQRQREWIDLIRSKGGIGEVVYSLECVRATLLIYFNNVKVS